MKSKTNVPHPGWACCDPDQDLQGWLDREQAAVALLGQEATALHAEGDQLDKSALTALLAGDYPRHQELQAASRHAYGVGNGKGQEAMIRAGHAGRVETAHAFRLDKQGPSNVAACDDR